MYIHTCINMLQIISTVTGSSIQVIDTWTLENLPLWGVPDYDFLV